MDKETLFKEIRQGRTLLWVGAGFSRYAEYPMGAGVVQILYDELSKAQREELAIQLEQDIPKCPDWPLPKFAQYFVDLHHGNRTRLIEILDRIFSAEPTRIDVHEKLARSTFINHIVTTNYDPLFELAYRPSRIHVVGQASQIPQIGNKEVTLYKIHGQPSNPESVIITEDDYNGFFNSADELVWTYLRGLMSTRTIVFLGYAVEDPNVLFVFDGLVKKLGKLMKPAYVIGPHMQRVREERLLRNNIHYIKATGEEFVDELWAYIQDTALAELPKEGLPAVTPVGQMLKNMGINFSMTLNGGEPLINKLSRSDRPTKNDISFSYNSKELFQSLQALERGDSLKPVRIDMASLTKFSHKVEGFRLPSDNNGVFWIAKSPGWKGKVDVQFNLGSTLFGVKVWAYGTDKKAQLVALSEYSRAEIVWSRGAKGNAGYKIYFSNRYETFPNTLAALEHATLLSSLAEGKSLTIFQNGQRVWTNGSTQTPADRVTIKDSKQMLNLVQGLQLIESEFNILFKNFDLTKQGFNEVEQLALILKQKNAFFKPEKSLAISVENPTIEQLSILSNKGLEPGSTVVRESQPTVDFTILGWVLRISWTQKEHLLDPIFRKDKQGNYFVRSKSSKAVIEYLGIDKKEVMQSFTANGPEEPDDEFRMKERLPQH